MEVIKWRVLTPWRVSYGYLYPSLESPGRTEMELGPDTLLRGHAALALIERHWFAAILPKSDSQLARLVLRIYLAAAEGKPLHKKAAWNALGIQDVKTGRRYLAMAEDLGLIQFERSPDDQRRELLYPTQKLQQAIELELKQLPFIDLQANPEARVVHADARTISPPTDTSDENKVADFIRQMFGRELRDLYVMHSMALVVLEEMQVSEKRNNARRIVTMCAEEQRKCVTSLQRISEQVSERFDPHEPGLDTAINEEARAQGAFKNTFERLLWVSRTIEKLREEYRKLRAAASSLHYDAVATDFLETRVRHDALLKVLREWFDQRDARATRRERALGRG